MDAQKSGSLVTRNIGSLQNERWPEILTLSLVIFYEIFYKLEQYFSRQGSVRTRDCQEI